MSEDKQLLWPVFHCQYIERRDFFWLVVLDILLGGRVRDRRQGFLMWVPTKCNCPMGLNMWVHGGKRLGEDLRGRHP